MSIRWKLGLLYALILVAVIGGLSLLVVIQIRAALMESLAAELRTRGQALGAVLEFEDGAWRIDPESALDREYREYSKHTGLYYLVYDRTQLSRPILASPGVPKDRSGVLQVDSVVRKTDEPPVATESRPFEAVIICGKDLSGINATIARVISTLLVWGPLVLVASLAGGWFLVSRALRPIDQMARTARNITETDLSSRVPIANHDELGDLAETLNETFDRLQQGFERERRFTADASHELRTPLAVVTGNVEVALNKDRPPAEYRQMLGDIGDAAARMQTIVEGLLTLARVDRHAAPRDHHSVAIAPLCEDVVRLHRPIAERADVSLDLTADATIELKADAEALKTVVSNLVSNAIRYNREGGRVGIGVGRENGLVRIRVEDTGIGIPKEHVRHVFERFYRVDAARTSASGGAGLGLAIAKAIVTAHNGAIAIKSELGKGTTVDVLLPG